MKKENGQWTVDTACLQNNLLKGSSGIATIY